MEKPIKVLLSEEDTKELLLDGWVQAKTEDGQDVDVHCNRKARNEVMDLDSDKLIEITKKDGSVWCQIFKGDTGEIISSFISDTETEAMEKAIAWLNEEKKKVVA